MTVIDRFKMIEADLTQILTHADELYRLVQLVDETRPTFDPINENKHRAGWHGHEIHKYIDLCRRSLSVIREDVGGACKEPQ